MKTVPGYASELIRQSKLRVKNYVPELDGIDAVNKVFSMVGTSCEFI